MDNSSDLEKLIRMGNLTAGQLVTADEVKAIYMVDGVYVNNRDLWVINYLKERGKIMLTLPLEGERWEIISEEHKYYLRLNVPYIDILFQSIDDQFENGGTDEAFKNLIVGLGTSSLLWFKKDDGNIDEFIGHLAIGIYNLILLEKEEWRLPFKTIDKFSENIGDMLIRAFYIIDKFTGDNICSKVLELNVKLNRTSRKRIETLGALMGIVVTDDTIYDYFKEEGVNFAEYPQMYGEAMPYFEEFLSDDSAFDKYWTDKEIKNFWYKKIGQKNLWSAIYASNPRGKIVGEKRVAQMIKYAREAQTAKAAEKTYPPKEIKAFTQWLYMNSLINPSEAFNDAVNYLAEFCDGVDIAFQGGNKEEVQRAHEFLSQFIFSMYQIMFRTSELSEMAFDAVSTETAHKVLAALVYSLRGVYSSKAYLGNTPSIFEKDTLKSLNAILGKNAKTAEATTKTVHVANTYSRTQNPYKG